jgi:hypothetical protein
MNLLNARLWETGGEPFLSGNLEEMAKKLEKFEREMAEKAKTFNPKELVKSSKEIHQIEIEGVGVIRYGVLTLADMLELNKAESNEERSFKILWLMLRKAYPELTLEDVKAFPMDVAAKILTALTADLGFLAPQKP